MRKCCAHFFLVLTFVVCLTASASPKAHWENLSDTEKIYGLSLFWQEVNYNFAFFDQVPELDWDSAYRAFIPQVLATDNIYDYYRVMKRFSALLHDGHTNIYYPDYINDTIKFPKVVLRNFNQRAFIINADSDLVPIIPPGSEIIEVDGQPTGEYLRKEVLPYISSSTEYVLWDEGIAWMLRGIKDSPIDITILKPDASVDTVTLKRNRDGVRWYRERDVEVPLLEFRWLEDSLAYVALNSFAQPEIEDMFKAHRAELEKAKGIIIDLRTNGGGNTSYGAAILIHFTSDTLIGSAWKTRQHVAAFKAWGSWGDEEYKPYVNGTAWYQGENYKVTGATDFKLKVPFVVLMDHRTGSAAEDFLILADKLKQATYVGRPSYGSTGQPLQIKLPGGGSARICAKRDTYPDGRDFVGYGVQPDVFVEPTLEDILTDHDVILEKGIEVLKSKIK